MPNIIEANNMMTCQDLIGQLINLGYSQKDIASELGVTTMTIYRYSRQDKIRKSIFAKLRRLYLKAKNPKYRDLEKFDTVDLVRALRARGWQVELTTNK